MSAAVRPENDALHRTHQILFVTVSPIYIDRTSRSKQKQTCKSVSLLDARKLG